MEVDGTWVGEFSERIQQEDSTGGFRRIWHLPVRDRRQRYAGQSALLRCYKILRDSLRMASFNGELANSLLQIFSTCFTQVA